MCEAFNGAFKRDYVYENSLDNRAIVHKQIQSWIDEYNQFAPHSALKVKTQMNFMTVNPLLNQKEQNR